MKSVVVSYRIRGLGQFPAYELENRPLKDFNHLYLVSVGKEHFEDDWVSGYVNFQRCLGSGKVGVLVADTVQRHTLSCYYGDDESGAFERSVENGHNWVKRYAPIFHAGLNRDVEIEFFHWNQFKDHAAFPRYFEHMQVLHATDPKFQTALDESVDEYMRRTSGREIFCTLEEKRRKSANYLIEECAVFYMLAQNTRLDGLIYPSKCPHVINYALQLANDETRKDSPFRWLEMYAKKVKVDISFDGDRLGEIIRPR